MAEGTTTDTQAGSTTTETTQPGQTSSSTQTGAPSPGTANPAPNTGVDDARYKGLLAEVQKERKARQDYEARARQFESQATERQRQIEALTGVRTPSADQQNEEAVKQAFFKMFPQFAKLSPEAIDTLLASSEKAKSFEEFQTAQWNKHSRGMLDSVADAISDELGNDLNDRQKKSLARFYVSRAENDPDFLARHEAGDPALVTEIAKEFMEDWFEPARRQATAQAVQQQRKVPNGRDRSIATAPPKKIDFTNEAAVKQAFGDRFKELGGTFDKG